MKRLLIIVLVVAGLIAFQSEVMAKKDAMVVEDGKTIKFHYLVNVDGKKVDESGHFSPLEIKVGEGQIVPGLAAGIMGMKAGETKKISVKPENGYGLVKEEAFQEVKKDTLPEGYDATVGKPVRLQVSENQFATGRISEVKDDAMMIDFNHPLAGKTLDFDIEIVEIME